MKSNEMMTAKKVAKTTASVALELYSLCILIEIRFSSKMAHLRKPPFLLQKNYCTLENCSFSHIHRP
jgi:hypothetical protein